MDEFKKDNKIGVPKWIPIWMVIVATCILVFFYFSFIIYWSWYEPGWMLKIVKEHYAASIGLPLAAMASTILVILLEIKSGSIEFEVFAFKFRGASGPIIMWILTFLTMAIAIRILW